MELRWAMMFFLLLCSSLSLSSSATTGSMAEQNDRSALLDFKKGITGDPSTILSSWNQTIHFCNWEGVTCGRKHPYRVTALNLSSKDLVGSLSPSIGNLSFLTTINLSYNSFHGAIPVNLIRCSDLRIIDLNNNWLMGSIPTELGSLSKLDTLGLGANNITGLIPPSLGNLSALTRLSLASNYLLGGIPEDLGRLANIEILLLSNNRLSGTIPPSLFNISSLYSLSMPLNQLEGSLPPTMGTTLPNLKYLLLAGNQFSGSIPASLTNATGLQVIDMPNNNLSGQVPFDLGRLQGLRYLNLNLNQLRARDDRDWRFFTSLTNCSNLIQLHLGANDLRGSLPGSIANLSAELQYLAIQDNQISGTISPGIENLVSLAALALYNNLLTSSIPQGIGKLNNLQWLGLYGNRLSGHIPPSIGNLTQLNYLGLSFNTLDGSIPPSLGKLRQLDTLALANNRLNGNIPKEILSLSSLSYVLNLANNSFVGSLPPEVGSLTNLGAFYVSNNQLSGEIPATIGDCQILEYLSMDHNQFQGAIPPSLGNIKGLRSLDLSHNNLSGPIPGSMESLNAIELLDLSFNHLVGEVPNKGLFSNATVVSLLGNDGLCGGSQQLDLPVCPQKSIERRKGSRLLRIVIPIVSSVLCLVILLCFTYCIYIYWRRKQTKQNSVVSSLEDRFHKISYTELAKATDGFSSANLVGMGKYGSVYMAILDHGRTTIAVKVFNLQQLGASKSFIAECEALRSIRHRNLVKILTSCSSIDSKGNEFKALVLEFMPNGSLETCLHAGQLSSLSLIQRLNIAIDAADALDYLHHDCQPPVVHCDVKPGNVLIDEDMSAHLSDFGLARILGISSQDCSSTIGIRGSIGYVAPEYGAGSQVSTSGDVYSFGILVLEMFTGRRPVDDMFKDGLSLHGYVEMALADRVMEIIDPVVLLQEDDRNDARRSSEAFQGCLRSVLRIGLSCSNQSPRERMDMRAAANEMHKIREVYLTAHSRGEA